MKKQIIALFFSMFLVSCTGVDLNSLNPIPTEANGGGFLQLGQDVLSGNWERFKKKESTPTEIFLNSPLLNEYGEEVQTNSFKLKNTKDFDITVCNAIITPKAICFIFAFNIKNLNTEIEYVKIQSVIPNDQLTFIDSTQKNESSDKIVSSEMIKNTNNNLWQGKVENMSNIMVTPGILNKYLFKFTIKSVGEPEKIIYQPCMLEVGIFNKS